MSLTFINSTISSNNSIDINVSELKIINDSNATISDSTTNGGNISISSGNLVLNINVTISVSTTNGNSGQISGGSNNRGSIILITDNILISRPVLEPSAIAGTIFASSLAKRKQAAFRKAKV
ncbi:hypothetical protein [Nostoc sp.]|uniref:hypothetical protein n=1 Tax=Nostoc sp. TaxID=1180 RepID=UPI002FF7D76A